MELREYRKRLSVNNGGIGRTPSLSNSFPAYGRPAHDNSVSHLSDVNFQFEFPKFGRLPGPSSTTSSNTTSSVLNGARQSASPTSIAQVPSPVDRSQISPLDRQNSYKSSNGSNAGARQASRDGGDLPRFSGLFSPRLFNTGGSNSNIDLYQNNESSGSRASTDSNGQRSNGQSTSYSSPSASSNSVHGASSSCGTSPEPSMQSPVTSKPADVTLSTIGEENIGTTSGEGKSFL
jgi:AP-1-like factor